MKKDTILVFLDTEFTSMYRPEMISFSLVPSSGEDEFYAEISDVDMTHCSDFVRTEVLPKLNHTPGVKMTSSQAKAAVQRWLERLTGYDTIIIAFDFDLDWELFSPLLDNESSARYIPWNVSRSNHTDNITFEISCESNEFRHHALSDARHLRDKFLPILN